MHKITQRILIGTGMGLCALGIMTYERMKATPSTTAKEGCPFCNEHTLQIQTIYEGEKAFIFYPYKPIEEGHCLIIPKRHVERFEDLQPEEYGEFSQLIQKTHAVMSRRLHYTDYLLLQKNGKGAGQTVPHMHIHYIPQKETHGSVIRFAWRMLWANLQPPLGQESMQRIVEDLNREFIRE